jgi:hypothetical protein
MVCSLTDYAFNACSLRPVSSGPSQLDEPFDGNADTTSQARQLYALLAALAFGDLFRQGQYADPPSVQNIRCVGLHFIS